jgi:hypothetical protein
MLAVSRISSVMFCGAICIAALAVQAQTTSTTQQVTGVPSDYAGNWVCQTSTPGYNVRPPHADPSQPLTNQITTPPSVQIVKFRMRMDGTYEAAGTVGHYVFDRATNEIRWIDGPHQQAFSRTQLGRRDNGAARMGFVFNKRYYGCFIAAGK